MLRSTFHNQVTTPIPPEVKPQIVVDLLHDHDFLITMSPIVTNHKEASRDSAKITYDVWEKIDLLPFGLWKQQIQFSTAFENKPDGTATWINAPLGLVSKAVYTVRGAEPAGEAGGMVLDESVESSINLFLRPIVESQLVPVRKEMHRKIIEKAREKSMGPCGGDVELPS